MIFCTRVKIYVYEQTLLVTSFDDVLIERKDPDEYDFVPIGLHKDPDCMLPIQKRLYHSLFNYIKWN